MVGALEKVEAERVVGGRIHELVPSKLESRLKEGRERSA